MKRTMFLPGSPANTQSTDAGAVFLKRLFKPIGLILCAGIFLSSCSKKSDIVSIDPPVINPLSDYSITPDPNDAFTYTFKSLAKNHVKQEWRFGDDTLKTEDNVNHVYLAPGKYTVDLKTLSSTGQVSHKFTDINILADNAGAITATKTSKLNEIQLGVNSKSIIKSIDWNFVDQSPTGGLDIPSTTSGLAPLKAYQLNTFNTLTAKVTTNKGSVFLLTRNITTEGILTDITQQRLSYTVNWENTDVTRPSEVSSKLLDGNVDTKMLLVTAQWSIPFLLTLNYASPQTVKVYAITNANDNKQRDPRGWNLEGSNDGVNWTVLDSRAIAKPWYDLRTDAGATTDAQKYKQHFYYAVANPQPFTMYRLDITTKVDAWLQFSEFQLFK